MRVSVQVVGCPEGVERAGPPRVPKPRLAAPGPMQEADRARVEVAAAAPDVVAAQAVLVPPVLDGRHVSREDQEERRQRAQLVDSVALLDLHPPFDPPRVPGPPPLDQIHHHHPRVEVARPPARERRRVPPVRPEARREVLGEVGVAVLRGPDRPRPEARPPQLRNVVHHDQIRVEVDDPPDAGLEQVRQVVPGVVQRLLQRLPHRRRDQAPHGRGIEVVHLEVELGEGGPHQGLEAALGDQEVEEDALRAERVMEDGMHGGDRAAEVLDVEGDRHVDQIGVADAGGPRGLGGAAFVRIAESRCLAE
ncbi:LOW QUALITY PROTEIN: hypothetical protein PanWU01x14_296860 [Parasponia andersonii]|uniref:Uncharacterized protein n=1 Tax=Parasponia andersonii TaxID=3476 RepID=A0A2P5AVF3_PARAD|nr:LOW QUALITY PROTEIN: hypothetical protein PanWU01x14_296860 [Parasponia andersonii]